MKKKNLKLAKFFSLCFVFVSIGLMLSLADLFSSLITVGGFTFTSDNLSISGCTMYTISISSTNNKIIADEHSENCKKQGGAGYIYLSDSAYNIIASIYESKADAENVKANLILSKPNTTIIEIKFPNITINSNLNSQEKNIISESLTIFKNVYKKLYDISVGLDTSIITEINAKLNINEVYGDANKVINNFDTMFSTANLTNFIELKTKLQAMQTSLSKLIDANSVLPYTSNIKYAYCEIMFLYKALAESLT